MRKIGKNADGKRLYMAKVIYLGGAPGKSPPIFSQISGLKSWSSGLWTMAQLM